jgi:hypothetical protein
MGDHRFAVNFCNCLRVLHPSAEREMAGGNYLAIVTMWLYNKVITEKGGGPTK